MTQTEELLKLSIIYRRLIGDIASVAGVDFSPDHKHRMMQVVSDCMAEAIMVYVARCCQCDSPIELVCDNCQD